VSTIQKLYNKKNQESFKGGTIERMKKQPLSQTNPFLKDPEERKFWITTTVTSSASIEGVHLSKEALETLQKGCPTFKYVYGKSSGSRK